MKILVVQNKMGIGDMIIYLPFIDAISKKFNTPVSILAKQSSKAEQFLKDHKNIEKIIILEQSNKLKGAKHQGFSGFINLVKGLRRHNFDKIFIFTLTLNDCNLPGLCIDSRRCCFGLLNDFVYCVHGHFFIQESPCGFSLH